MQWADSKYFKPSEFDSPDFPGSGQANMSLSLIKILNDIRDEIGFPLPVTSGFRTPAHNKVIGGNPNSAHLRGLAVDILVGQDSHKRFLLVKYAILFGIFRFEIAPAHVHLDIDTSLPKEEMIHLAAYPSRVSL